MINLIICICGFIFGSFLTWYDCHTQIKQWWLDAILTILRIFSFFTFGFFMMEAIKYFNGQPTLIF